MPIYYKTQWTKWKNTGEIKQTLFYAIILSYKIVQYVAELVAMLLSLKCL